MLNETVQKSRVEANVYVTMREECYNSLSWSSSLRGNGRNGSGPSLRCSPDFSWRLCSMNQWLCAGSLYSTAHLAPSSSLIVATCHIPIYSVKCSSHCPTCQRFFCPSCALKMRQLMTCKRETIHIIYFLWCLTLQLLMSMHVKQHKWQFWQMPGQKRVGGFWAVKIWKQSGKLLGLGNVMVSAQSQLYKQSGSDQLMPTIQQQVLTFSSH